jgi:diketogulonate reductase-like aldo/keto reductase
MNIPNVKLNSGHEIPMVGFGLWKVKKESECKTAVALALEAGYRHFDSAQIYGNEQFLGAALKDAGIPRQDLFITTKLWNGEHWPEDAMASFDESLRKLQMDYVDLFLIHFPVTETRRMAWQSMEAIFKSGRAKSIGVSNYTIKHLKELLAECEIKPAVNQVELHVFLQQPELVEYCKQQDIVVEAYSPLAHGHGLNDPTLKQIADKYGVTPAQVMLRWCIEVGTVPLPKSVTPSRIKENLDIFDFIFDDDDKTKIKQLERNLRTCWDPTNVA